MNQPTNRQPRVPWAPISALLFVGGCLATIPYGAPIGGIPLIALACLAAITFVAARFDGENRYEHLRLWPVVTVLSAYGISISQCQLPSLAFQRSASMPLFAMVAVAVQICHWDRRTARLFGGVLVLPILAMTADIVCQRLTGTSLIRGIAANGGRLPGSQDNPNDMAAACLLMPMALALMPHKRRWLWQVSLALFAAPTWVLSASRQALGAWFISVISGAIEKGRIKRSLLVVGALFVAASLVVVATPGLRSRVNETLQSGLAERLPIMAFGGSLIEEHAFTGIGPGIFGSYYQRAAQAGWTWRGEPLVQVGMPWVHSLPLEIACEYGAVGVIAFGLVVLCAIRRSWRGVKTNNSLARGTLAGLLCFIVVGTIDLTFIKDWVRCEFWLLIGMAWSVGCAGDLPATKNLQR